MNAIKEEQVSNNPFGIKLWIQTRVGYLATQVCYHRMHAGKGANLRSLSYMLFHQPKPPPYTPNEEFVSQQLDRVYDLMTITKNITYIYTEYK